MSWDSRTWDDVLDMLETVGASHSRHENRFSGPESARLAEIAAELSRMEDRMAEPMPPEVEAFVREYAPQR
jgi:hypothetical protein